MIVGDSSPQKSVYALLSLIGAGCFAAPIVTGIAVGTGALAWGGALAYKTHKEARRRNRPRWQAITEGVTITDTEIAELVKILKSQKRPLSNDDVATRLGVVKGESSKRVAKAVGMGLVYRQRVGKQVAISLLN